MKLILEGEDRIRFEMTGDGFEMASEGASISPYHLLAGSLASCTALTVDSWAQGAGFDISSLVISVAWEMVEERPKRISRLDMELRWPSLPADRVDIAERVADLCPIHATLVRAAEVSRRVIPG